MEYADEEIGPEPEVIRYHYNNPVGRYKETTNGLSRYGRHKSRSISKNEQKEMSESKLNLALLVWLIVLIVIVLLIIFYNQKILSSKLGYLALGVSVLFILSIVGWYWYCPNRYTLGFMIVLVVMLVFWWVLVEILQYDHIPDVLAVSGIIVCLVAYWYYSNLLILIPILAFLVLLYVSNFGLKNNLDNHNYFD